MSNDLKTDLNPFALLAVTTRDDPSRIMEAAETQSLFHDAEACQQARATLTNPRRRVEAEFGWFPGVAPGMAQKAFEAARYNEILDLPLTGLAKANGVAYAALKSPPPKTEDLHQFLKELTSAADDARLDRIVIEINEDRQIAGIPPITNEEVAADAFKARQLVWRRAALDVLNRAPSAQMAEAMYNVVKQASATGQFPRALHEVIDDYALRASPFILKELQAANALVDKARELAASRPDALVPILDAIGVLLETWEELTFPIHMSAKIRGSRHDESEELAYLVRGLSIDLFNQHGLTQESKKLSEMLERSFSVLPEIAQVLAKDAKTLDEIQQDADAREAEIAYAANIGKITKTRLAISSAGLEWKGRTTPLEDVKYVRWGGVRKSINGIPTGTDYLIAWNDGRRLTTVEFSNQIIFDAFVQRLFKALADSIVSDILTSLRAGHSISVGNAIIKDSSVILRRRKFFSEEPAEYSWSDVSILSQDGSFVIEGPNRSKALASMSYREDNNVHFIEMLVRFAFSKGITQLTKAF